MPFNPGNSVQQPDYNPATPSTATTHQGAYSMPLLDKADRCRRLAREIIGDPMEAALLRLAAEFEAAAGVPLPTEPPDRAAA